MKYLYRTENQYSNQKSTQIANLGDLMSFGHPQIPSSLASRISLSIENGGVLMKT